MSLEYESAEQYNAAAFAADVNEAAAKAWDIVRATVTGGFTLDPQLRASMSTNEALTAVCLCLMSRVLFEEPKQGDVVLPEWERSLLRVLDNTKQLLIQKNAAYGNSALNPTRLFSKASLKEQLLVRLDDKASRIARGSKAGEDVVADMLGYFILLLIAEKREAAVP